MAIQTDWFMFSRGALGAALIFGCGDPRDGQDDSSTREALAACPAARVFEPGLFSLPDRHEYRIAFTPDGKTAFFGRSEQPFVESRESTIYMSELRDGSWSEPLVAPFSGVYPDIDPFVSNDGERLYFSSIRPVAEQPRSDVDLWAVERQGEGWGEPRNLGSAVNSDADELFPSVTADGDIYFGSDRPGGLGAWDIWRIRLSAGASEPDNLGAPINTDGFEFNPWVSPGGHALLFTGLNHPDGFGAGDLYASVDVGSGFGAALNLGPCINTPADEHHAAPRLDSGQLFFARLHFDPEWIPGELYVLDLHRLGLAILE
jgi:hypothetical protein